MEHVKTQVAWSNNAQKRVHVRTVSVNQSTATVNEFDDLPYLLFKETESVGIGQHQACDSIIAFRSQRFNINVSARIGWQLDYPQPAHRSRRGIRSVS